MKDNDEDVLKFKVATAEKPVLYAFRDLQATANLPHFYVEEGGWDKPWLGSPTGFHPQDGRYDEPYWVQIVLKKPMTVVGAIFTKGADESAKGQWIVNYTIEYETEDGETQVYKNMNDEPSRIETGLKLEDDRAFERKQMFPKPFTAQKVKFRL